MKSFYNEGVTHKLKLMHCHFEKCLVLLAFYIFGHQAIKSIALSVGAVEYTDCTSAEVKTTPNECPGYDTKQSDGEVQAVLVLWGMQSTPSLPSLPGPLWPGVVAPDKGPIYGLNRTNSILMLN